MQNKCINKVTSMLNFMIFYATTVFLCYFYDNSKKNSFFMIFYDFMPSGSPEKIIKLTGKGKLTESIINSLQNYYGLAIRGNKGQLYPMIKAVAAVLHYCTDFREREFRHRYCPAGTDSWCKFKLDKLKGKKASNPHNSIPKRIYDVIRSTWSNTKPQ